jgi:hypothetical protein
MAGRGVAGSDAVAAGLIEARAACAWWLSPAPIGLTPWTSSGALWASDCRVGIRATEHFPTDQRRQAGHARRGARLDPCAGWGSARRAAQSAWRGNELDQYTA